MGALTNAMASTIDCRLWPKTATSAIAKTNTGKAWRRAAERMRKPGASRVHHKAGRELGESLDRLVLAAERAQHRADQGREQRAEHRDREVDARRPDHAREDVHPGGVGAQEVGPARGLEEHVRVGELGR